MGVMFTNLANELGHPPCREYSSAMFDCQRVVSGSNLVDVWPLSGKYPSYNVGWKSPHKHIHQLDPVPNWDGPPSKQPK